MSNPSPSRWKEIFGELKRVLSKNWGYKLLSLLLAAVIWSVLIAQDPTITREKTINDVSVSVTGTDNMKRNGFVVTNDLSEQLKGVTIRSTVPQMQYHSVTAANYVPRIDLSRVNASGTQEVRILTTNSSTYGQVMEVTPATVRLEVEDYITRNRIPIVLETEGEVPEGWYITSSTVDPTMLTISGPRSVVESVVRAEALQDLSNVQASESVQRYALPFRLVNAKGETVESDLIEITSLSVLIDSVLLEQTVYPTKMLDFSKIGVLVGEPAKGYEVKSVTYSPMQIRAAGKSDTLKNLDSLFSDASVDVSNASVSFSQTLRLRKPGELAYLSQDSVTITVEIGDIITEKTFTDVRIHATNVDGAVSAALDERYADLVTVTGPENWLNSLRGTQLLLTVDATGLTQEGKYELPVQCAISGDEGLEYTVKTSPATVTLNVRAR
ncbi:MAG: hypothetical protein K6A68_14465 [Clostridiales bacterium]|nr:hypothetical protein [Clostridiales bacterium]